MTDGADFLNLGYGTHIHQQHATCTIFAAVQTPHPLWAGDKGHGKYDLSPDVVQCSFEETFQGQTCSFTLVPNRPYREILYPGDWVSVYFSTNSENPPGFGVLGRESRPTSNHRVMVGVIDAVRQSVTVDDTTGATQVRISVSCSGINKAFDKTSIYYNEHLGPQTLFGAMMPGLSTLTKNVPLIGTPATLPRIIGLTYLGFGGQFLLPDSYPTAQGTNRAGVLQSFLKRSLDIEKQLGFLSVRLGQANAPQRKGLGQRLFEKQQELITPNSIATLVDFFGHVEDFFVDGRTQNSTASDLTGTVWNLMMENSNPIMNECFLSMLPAQVEELHSDKDEWGQSPAYYPALVVRERPFSWVDETFDIPSFKSHKRRRKVRFGNVFFSSRENPVSVPQLQLPEKATNYMRLKGFAGLGAEWTNDQYRAFSNTLNIPLDQLKLAQEEANQTKRPLLDLLVEDNFITQKQADNFKKTVGTAKTADEFTGKRFLDRVKIRPVDIKNETLGTSDNDMYNMHMITQTVSNVSHQQYMFVQDGLVPIYLVESMRRYGLRLRDLSTKFAYLGGAEISGKAAQDFLVRCLLAQDMWYQHQPYYLAGTIETPGLPEAHVGMALDVGGTRQESFYIEGLSHEWSHPGRLASTFTVTRGQPSAPDKRFNYAPPDSVKVSLDFGGVSAEVRRAVTDDQPLVERPLLDKNDDVAMAKALDLFLDQYKIDKKEAQKQKTSVLLYLRDKKDISQAEFEAILAKTQKKIRVEADVKTKLDRSLAGRPPWIVQPELHGAMWDSIRRGGLSDDAANKAALIQQFGSGKGNK